MDSRKRKREDADATNPFFRPFSATIKSTSKPCSFIPVAHLPRADLPLIWLDYTFKKSLIQPGALLDAHPEEVHVKALQDHAVLVVRRVNGGLYALERAGYNTYIACGIQPWVSENRVISQSLGHAEQDDLQSLLDHRALISGNNLPTNPRTPKKPKDRRGALARIEILPVKQPTPVPGLVDATEDEPLEAQPKLQSPTPNLSATEVCCEVQPLDLELLRAQYLDALYSKTSLAYFAKGPLARVRIEIRTEDLLCFYQDSIISTKKFDLKYKESIHNVIESAKSALVAAGNDEIGSGSNNIPNPRVKPSRRKKIGKDALYPAEGDRIRRFWLEREITTSNPLLADTQSREQRKLVSDLKIRETKMQILLILEALVLQASPLSHKEPEIATDGIVKNEAQEENTSILLAKTPTKPDAGSKGRAKNYSSELDTLIDRLCIWHAVGIDDFFESPEKKVDNVQKPSSNGRDQLRGFCADVIIPYYASRLPEQCRSICRKLGGPEASPPKRMKPTLTKSASMPLVQPGVTVKRPLAVPRKTLERVLSDDRSLRHSSPPTLSRSSGMPSVSNRKREPSESLQRPGSRGALHKSVSFSNREIDLDADARVQEAKRRKLARIAEQKKDLDAAIAALKKPNRAVAAQGLMDEIENRTLESKRKQVVQIAATPRRVKPMANSNRLAPVLIDVGTDEAIVPSSAIRPRDLSQKALLPSSTTKQTGADFAFPDAPIPPDASKAMDRVMGGGEPVSVYDALGWNDDYDL